MLWNLQQQEQLFKICTDILEFYIYEKDNPNIYKPKLRKQYNGRIIPYRGRFHG